MVFKFGEFEADYALTIGALSRFGEQFGGSMDQLSTGRVDLFAKLLWCCLRDERLRESHSPDDIFGDLEISELKRMAEAIGQLTGEAPEEGKKKRRSGRTTELKSA